MREKRRSRDMVLYVPFDFTFSRSVRFLHPRSVMATPPGRLASERRTVPREGATQPARHAFYEVLRWIGRRVQGFHSAVGLFLSLAFVFALLAAGAFAGLAEGVMEGETQQFDDAVLLWLSRYHSETMDIAALEITALGSGTVVWMTVLLASAFLWVSKHRYSVLLLWVAVIGGAVLNLVLKAAFDRPRPELFDWRTPYAGQSSFPSGHAMTAVVVYWTLAYLISRFEPTRLLQLLTWAFAAVVILLIGLSRLYLGVHYPSDVLAGFVIGFAWASMCALGIETVRYFRGRKPDVGQVEKDLHRTALDGETP
jgi:undecaprenyl-diphosphatase